LLQLRKKLQQSIAVAAIKEEIAAAPHAR